MALMHFVDADGNIVPVGADNPLPGSGGGGGMAPEDITAQAPATWDAETSTIGVSVGTGATQAAAGDHTHQASAITGLADVATSGSYGDLSGSPSLAPVATSGSYGDLSGSPVAAFVPNADGTDASTVAASVDALRDALIAAGLMASS